MSTKNKYIQKPNKFSSLTNLIKSENLERFIFSMDIIEYFLGEATRTNKHLCFSFSVIKRAKPKKKEDGEREKNGHSNECRVHLTCQNIFTLDDSGHWAPEPIVFDCHTASCRLHTIYSISIYKMECLTPTSRAHSFSPIVEVDQKKKK